MGEKKKVQYHMSHLINGKKIDSIEKLSVKILNSLDSVYGYNIYKRFFESELQLQKQILK